MSWTDPTIDLEWTPELLKELGDAVDRLVEGNGRGRHLYKVRASDDITVLRVDVMREWSPWMEKAWSQMIELGTWKVFAFEADSRGAFLFIKLSEEPLDDDQID